MNKGFLAALLLVSIICAVYIALANVFGRSRIDFSVCPLCERPVSVPRQQLPLHPGMP